MGLYATMYTVEGIVSRWKLELTSFISIILSLLTLSKIVESTGFFGNDEEEVVDLN